MVSAIVYTTPECVRCNILKEWLRKVGAKFEERNLANTEVQAGLILRDVFDFSSPILEYKGKIYSSDQIFKGEDLQISALRKFLEIKR